MLIFTWFLKNPLGQKVGIVLICLVVGFVALNWYGNREYSKGKAIGVSLGAEDMRKSMEAAWKVKEEAIAVQQKQLIAESADIQKQKAQLAGLRNEANKALVQINANAVAQMERANATVNSIPGDQLDDALRRLSAELGPPEKYPPE